MSTMKPLRPRSLCPALAALWLAAVPATTHAELILLEQFDYSGVNQNLDGQNGGAGFAGPWSVTGWGQNFQTGRTEFAQGAGTVNNPAGGLDFPGLPTAGSGLTRFGTAGQRAATRILSPSSVAELTADNSTIWFTVLMAAPNNNAAGSLVFGTDAFVAQQTNPPFPNGNLNNANGQGFGVGFRTDNNGVLANGSGSPNAIAFVNSDAATVDVGSFQPALSGTHFEPVLVLGKINWKPNGTPDELFLFNITDPIPFVPPDESTAIASLTADFDQSTWDTLSIWDTGTVIFDEIRFGTSYAAVTGVPEPTRALLLAVALASMLLRRRR